MNRSLPRRAFLATMTKGAAAAAISAGWVAPNVLDAAEPIVKSNPMNPRLFTFIGGNNGAWSVTVCKAVTGEPLPAVKRLDILNASVAALPDGAQWMLRGVRRRNNSSPNKRRWAALKRRTPR
jgi:hypothetical protein